MKMLFAALAVSLALVACGGGGSSSIPSTASAKTTTPTQPASCANLLAQGTALTPKCHVTIAWIGDSTYRGTDIDSPCVGTVLADGTQGAMNIACPTPAQLLQARFDAKYGPGVVGVIDKAQPGATFPSYLNGTSPNTQPLATVLASLPVHADIVTAGLEINDQYVIHSSVTQMTANAQAFIATVVQYGAVPVYLEPNPISRSDMNITDPVYGTNALTAAADQAFANAGFPALGQLYSWENYTMPPNAQPWNIVFMSSDEVHPSQAGYVFKVNNYFDGAPNVLGVTNSLDKIVQDMLAGRQS